MFLIRPPPFFYLGTPEFWGQILKIGNPFPPYPTPHMKTHRISATSNFHSIFFSFFLSFFFFHLNFFFLRSWLNSKGGHLAPLAPPSVRPWNQVDHEKVLREFKRKWYAYWFELPRPNERRGPLLRQVAVKFRNSQWANVNMSYMIWPPPRFQKYWNTRQDIIFD